MSGATVRIGIDLGGTKIAGIALDRDEQVCASHRVFAPRHDYAATLHAIGSVVEEIETQAGSTGSVGIGMPGSLDRASGRVQNANSTWLNGQDIRRDIERVLARRVRLANDANCFALSEATDGAARGYDVVFGVILGTGCGGGLVIGGRLISGRQNIAGEWGHNPLPWPTGSEHPGPQCWCGRHGCLETWISGSGLERDHAGTCGEALTGQEIVAAAAGGAPAAQASLARHANRLARGLAHVVNIADPDAIVLGGGLSNMQHLYDEVPDMIQRHVFADHPVVRLLAPLHGDASGVRGAARLWENPNDV